MAKETKAKSVKMKATKKIRMQLEAIAGDLPSDPDARIGIGCCLIILATPLAGSVWHVYCEGSFLESIGLGAVVAVGLSIAVFSYTHWQETAQSRSATAAFKRAFPEDTRRRALALSALGKLRKDKDLGNQAALLIKILRKSGILLADREKRERPEQQLEQELAGVESGEETSKREESSSDSGSAKEEDYGYIPLEIEESGEEDED